MGRGQGQDDRRARHSHSSHIRHIPLVARRGGCAHESRTHCGAVSARRQNGPSAEADRRQVDTPAHGHQITVRTVALPPGWLVLLRHTVTTAELHFVNCAQADLVLRLRHYGHHGAVDRIRNHRRHRLRAGTGTQSVEVVSALSGWISYLTHALAQPLTHANAPLMRRRAHSGSPQMCLFWVPFNGALTQWLPREKVIVHSHIFMRP